MKCLRYWRILPTLATLVFLLGGTPPLNNVKADPPGFTPASIRFEDDEVLDIAIQGNVAYVGLPDNIVVLDISHPLNPVIRGSIQGWGGAMDVQGDRLYANLTSNIVSVIDISDPWRPIELGGVDIRPFINDMVAMGTYVYTADWGGLTIIDVSNPYSPTIASEFYDQGFQYDIDVAEDLSGPTPKRFVYLTGEPDHYRLIGGGFRIVDVTDPTNPQIVYPCLPHVPNCRGAFGIHGVEVSERYAYVTYTENAAQVGGIDGRRGLNIWDISVSNSPIIISTLEMPTAAYYVAVRGNRAFVTSDEGLHTIDVSDPVQPRQVGLQGLEVAGSRARVATSGACVYAAEGARGLRILCETNITPTPPSLVYLPMVQAAG